MEASFYDKIMDQQRLEPEFFRVGFYGKKFPFFLRVCVILTSCSITDVTVSISEVHLVSVLTRMCICVCVCVVQNKEFVCRGHDYERLEAFQQRMLNEFPHAIAMQHANQPDQTIYQAEAQCILQTSLLFSQKTHLHTRESYTCTCFLFF